MKDLNLILIDDHPLFRVGIKTVIKRNPQLNILAEAGTGNEGFKLVKDKSPDLVILDISLPDITGLDLLEKIKNEFPEIVVLILSMHSKFKYIARSFQLGAKGYLIKESAAENLIAAIESAIEGRFYLDKSIANRVIDKLVEEKNGIEDTANTYNSLTRREQEVMRLIVEEYSNKEIAEKLEISVRTVDIHRSNIMSKIGVKNTIQLIKYAAKIGLIDIEQE